MKKITLLLAMAVAVVFSASAQKNATNVTSSGVNIAKVVAPSIAGDPKTFTIDTLWSPTAYLPCGDSLTYYVFDQVNPVDTGYVTGNNIYGDLEKGMLVKHTGTSSVNSVLAMIVKKGNVGTGTCAVKIYSKGSDNMPNTLLGTSDPITLSTITTNLNSFSFATPVSVTGDFFATIVLPTVDGDTIVVVSTKATCTPDPDSLSIEKWGDGTFIYLKTQYDFNPDLAIWPIVETVTGITNATIDNINVYSSNNEIVIENGNKSSTLR